MSKNRNRRKERERLGDRRFYTGRKARLIEDDNFFDEMYDRWCLRGYHDREDKLHHRRKKNHGRIESY